MKNVSDTETYSLFDHAFSKAVRSLSRVVGLRRITQPFWSRWLASGVRGEIIFRLLDELGSIDGWATVAKRVVADEVNRYRQTASTLTPELRVAALRELSYLCNMAQWGSLPITGDRRDLYRQCRDFYIEAETLAFGPAYRRLGVPFEGSTYHANLHIAPQLAPGRPAGLIVIVHGIDGCKEEHLATELVLHQAGFSVLCLDGPGQAEALLLDELLWRKNFPAVISAAIDAVAELNVADVSRTGVLGISIGGTWALRASADDHRIKAVFDLGGPLNTQRFSAFPFLIKTRICQITGARDATSIQKALTGNSVDDDAVLQRIHASVRIVQGSRDRIVTVADKEWLLGRLKVHEPERRASLRIIANGDHCCTGHAEEVRRDIVAFFSQELRPPPAEPVSS